MKKDLSMKKLLKVDYIAVIVALILEVAIFGILSPYFFTMNNLLTILQYCALTGLVALPYTLLMISGNFDMSMGSQVALVS